MRWSAVPLLLCVVLAAGCASRTAVPEPTLEPVARDASSLVTSLVARVEGQYSVRFDAETAMSGRKVRAEGGLVRSRDARLVMLREDNVEVVVLPDAGYLRSDGGSWTRLGRTDRAGVKSGVAVDGLADEVDPRSVVSALRGSLVVETGDESLDGVPTHRYTMLVDLRSQAEQTSDVTHRSQLLAAYESGFTATAVLWVGPGGLPVRVEQVLKTLEDNIFQRTQHRFTNWNTDLRIVAPTR
ncbi:hypothetical protein ABZ816_22315 [Actinosynnema sp. NPDC047251]|uniref:Putative secreted protein n=1 Tax=Saccharothrix espanaensis (strain ATCC 51144 / DSM 44229 / JCM 9112 / NBRC 15066 / NRRL 15764) TaxID=1179773 RepID=K0K0A5_SACES|nr:hypothetical protein [Saccharothrix espanaensis]CCH33665.1 putative secreted protein [Saccharothrix espanaensis DSM 44229]